MDRTKKNQTRRIRNLIVIFALTAVIVSVSTYAWFIGMRVVNVTAFDVTIQGTESLMLSLDGKTFDYTVTINEKTHNDLDDYANNTNWWAGKGLIPMSSVGEIDGSSSRLKLYEKASLTPTPGGYRLLASRIQNASNWSEHRSHLNDGDSAKTHPEIHGYVAFDLFIRNYTGANYITELNVDDEEAIYLTVDSEVTVADSGVAGTGIENSVRVAFAEIGRVIGTETDESIIQSITCADNEESGITGICRAAQIWEPNDTSHVQGAISWYKESCLQRSGLNVNEKASYKSDACGLVIDGLAYPTYAINQAVPSRSNVDIYDGAAFNNYAGSSTYLTSVDYFTDTMKYKTGTSRPTFMTLAPNSITKVRVYIFIEGQDIDNYDFSSIGQAISIAFGFTKQRYTEDDFDYPGEDANQGLGPDAEDLTPPRITLLGDAPVELTVGADYEDAGATANDNIDGDLTTDIQAIGTVNTDVPGTYRITYKVRDAAGNLGIKTRTIVVSEE